jgi:hypothetical protein
MNHDRLRDRSCRVDFKRKDKNNDLSEVRLEDENERKDVL